MTNKKITAKIEDLNMNEKTSIVLATLVNLNTNKKEVIFLMNDNDLYEPGITIEANLRQLEYTDFLFYEYKDRIKIPQSKLIREDNIFSYKAYKIAKVFMRMDKTSRPKILESYIKIN